MTIEEFIREIKPILKQKGYRKSGSYWYLEYKDVILCFNVQGSQWDTRNYYINIGAALNQHDKRNPTLLHWLWQHRCPGINVSVQDALDEADRYFTEFIDTGDFGIFCRKHGAIGLMTGQYLL